MYCAHCGTKLKADARFCGNCGAPATAETDSSFINVEPETPAARNFIDPAASMASSESTQGGFVGQMEQDRNRSRKKLSPLMIVVLALALMAGTAFAAILFINQANQSEEEPHTAQQEQVESSAEQSSASGEAEQESASGESVQAESAEAQTKTEEERAKAEAERKAAAEAEAREAAKAASKQIFTGTIMVTTVNDAWVMSIGQNPNPGGQETITILFLDEKTSIEGSRPYLANDGYRTFPDQDVIVLPDSYASYDGQRVEMAFSSNDLILPQDVNFIRGDGEIIATLDPAA